MMLNQSWILALVIVLFFEGAFIGIAPDKWKQTMRELIGLPSKTLRKIGLSMAAAAVLLLLWQMV